MDAPFSHTCRCGAAADITSNSATGGMAFQSIILPRPQDALSSSKLGYRLTILLWAFYLITPQKLLQYYVPDARPAAWLGEVLLWLAMGLLVLSKRQPGRGARGYPAFSLFMLLTVLGMEMAAIYGEWDRARAVLRQLYQFYFLGILAYTYCDTPQRAMRLFQTYALSFLFFGCWGLASLIYEPIRDGVDPGFRNIVYWHVHYGNRDAFGPLMAVGLAFTIHYARAISPQPKWAYAGALLSAIGVVTSFARGAFLSVFGAALIMWTRAKHRGRVLAVVLVCIGIVPVAAPGLTMRYLGSMSTIFSEGTEKGTGADRKILWSWAWRVFQLNPIAGVGPLNFGVAVFDVVTLQEAAKFEYTRTRLYGRVLHSTPMTILCEYGLLGVGAFLFLIVDFLKTNASIRRAVPSQTDPTSGFPPGYVNSIALGLQVAFIALCINCVFYEILYIPIFWNLIALNRMLYFVSGAEITCPAWKPWGGRPISGSTLDHSGLANAASS
jgi:O-antigen ligase